MAQIEPENLNGLMQEAQEASKWCRKSQCFAEISASYLQLHRQRMVSDAHMPSAWPLAKPMAALSKGDGCHQRYTGNLRTKLTACRCRL